MKKQLAILAVAVVTGLTSQVFSQNTKPPAAKPPATPAAPAAPALEKPEKLTDAAADALQNYLYAQYTNDDKLLQSLVKVSNADKQLHANAIMSFVQAQRVLERATVAKFGAEEGLRPLAHARSLDDQTKLDLTKRIKDANVQYTSDKTAATIFLRIEMNRPENLQMGDRFNYLDTYEMAKVGGAWKVDYLKTYKCLDPEQDENYKSEIAAFPKMTKVFMDLAESIKKGQYKTADEVKNTIDTKWETVYDEPTRIQLKPGEKPPTDASAPQQPEK